MAKYGFTGGVPEIKLLILYTLSSITIPVSFQQLIEIALIDDGVDYFAFCHALEDTVQSSHVLSCEKAGVVLYTVSPRGYEISGLMEGTLPNALKMAIKRTAQVVESRAERDSFVIAEAFTRGGMPNILCELTDGTDPMLHIEIVLGNEKQSGIIADNFRKNAEKIYHRVLEVLTGEI